MSQEITVWKDGEFIDAAAAAPELGSPVVQYGLGVFEGIRCHRQPDGSVAYFRLDDHLDRLSRSCRLYGFEPEHGIADVRAACLEVARRGKLSAGYLRILVGLGGGPTDLLASARNKPNVWIMGWERGPSALKTVRLAVSSYRRMSPSAWHLQAKGTGNYVNSYHARREADRMGVDDAILLDGSGHVAESSVANVFIVRNRKLQTPTRASALEGITRDTIMTLAQELGIEAQERNLSRDELCTADEVFLTGTAAGVKPVAEISGVRIGDGEMGPVTGRLREAYQQATVGQRGSEHAWLVTCG